MSFKLPDLIIESIIRDGLNNARRDETVIDDVFEELTRSYASKKYGQAEIERIKQIIRDKEVSIVHAFNAVNSNIPCISIQLMDDREAEEKAQMGGYLHNYTQKFSTPEKIASTVVVSSFTPDSHDPLTGTVKVPDSVGLGAVHVNLLFVDTDKNEFPIIGGIDNDPGEKQFCISRGSAPNIAGGCEIKSSIDYDLFLRRGNVEMAQVVLGIHTAEPLLTKYLYILVKYFVLSRRFDMVNRGYELSTYSGSDFTRNVEYGADSVFTRFFHLSGMVLHQWRADKVQLIDSVDVKVKVAKDKLGNEALGKTNATVQVKE